MRQSIRYNIAAALVAISLTSVSDGRLLHGSGTLVTSTDLKVGAGGYITGSSIAADNTQIIRTDTYGAYKFNPNAAVPCGNNGCSGAWQQLLTPTSMPSNFTASGQQLYNFGVYEIAIAPSDSTKLYMTYYQGPGHSANGTVLQSTNGGSSWTDTGLASSVTVTYGNGQTLNANGPYRFYGQKMAVDPNSPTTVYVGLNTSGLWKLSGGTWTHLTNFPAATSDPGITGLAVNPANSSNVFGFSYGNGVYESNDGGSTWTHITTGTGPTIAVGTGVISGNGNYFVCEPQALGSGTSNFWVWNGATWAKIFTGGGTTSCGGIAVSPSNNNWIRVVSGFGPISESTTGGGSGTWTAFSDNGTGGNPTFTSPDIPWLASFIGGPGYGALWDTANPSTGKMLFGSSRGFATSTVAQGITGSTVTSPTDRSVGIEQLVATQVMVPPYSGATPIVCNWDSPVFQPNLSQYPSTVYPVNNTNVVGCWSIDYVPASPVTQFVINADGDYVGNGISRSGICTIGGSCTLFSAIGAGLPANAYPNNTAQGGGDIAAADANHILFAPGSSGGTGTNPYYTTNGGLSWNQVTISGVTWGNFSMSPNSAKAWHLVCADKVANPTTNPTFYLINPIGQSTSPALQFTTNGGLSWNSAASFAGAQFAPVPQMHCTPPLGSSVVAGDIWIATGSNGSQGSQPGGGALYHITAANTLSPTTTVCSNVQTPVDIGFSAPKNGNTYPSIYIVGWVGATPAYGLWRSDDQCSTWTLLDTWPMGSMDQATTVAGDPNSWNKVYVGFGGSGYTYKQY